MEEVTNGSANSIWRVFYTMARAEKKCEERLQQAQVQVFLPKLLVTRQWSDRKKKILEPLFPNYIFALVDEKERLRVLQTEGIVRSVSFGGRIAELTEDEIEQLRITQRHPELLSAMAFPRPEIGSTVNITEGPFHGLKGEVLQHLGETYIVIRISAIRQAVRVRIPEDWVQVERTAPFQRNR